MRLFQSADALRLTGLTRSQLREWTGRGRRELISPDVDPSGPGRHALFAWQTLLTLRLLRVLHQEFAAEVAAWTPAAKDLRQKLDRVSFPTLWRQLIYFPNRQLAMIIDNFSDAAGPGIVIPLEPHLEVLATGLALARADQLSLFPPMVVSR